MFNQLNGEVTLIHDGIYSEVKMYEWVDKRIFADFFGGYIQLFVNGTTSKQNTYIARIKYLDGRLGATSCGCFTRQPELIVNDFLLSEDKQEVTFDPEPTKGK